MPIETIFAHISCSNLETSAAWYEKLFGRAPSRKPMAGLLEWQFTASAEVQLFEDSTHAGTSTLTVGVLPIEPEYKRLVEAGLDPGPIEASANYFLVRLRDPDGNLIVFASARKS
jgi:catechol 2,3-dioxygenase-like lactoylglutathione lyase family enzyme